MAATVFYFSTNAPSNQDRAYTVAGTGASGSLNQGTTATDLKETTDYIQLSIKAVLANGSTATGVSKRDILNFLKAAERWVLASSGSNSGAVRGEGLDYVIKANGGSVGVP
jgi:hypothetical protein